MQYITGQYVLICKYLEHEVSSFWNGSQLSLCAIPCLWVWVRPNSLLMKRVQQKWWHVPSTIALQKLWLPSFSLSTPPTQPVFSLALLACSDKGSCQIERPMLKQTLCNLGHIAREDLRPSVPKSARNGILPATTCVSLDTDPSPVDCSCYQSPWARETSWVVPEFLTYRNWDNKCCCFKPPNFKIICYSAICN